MTPLKSHKFAFPRKTVAERKHVLNHISRNVPLLVVPCQILLRQCPETVFRRPKGVQNVPFCVQKAFLSVRTGRVRMKIYFFESLSQSLKTLVFEQKEKIIGPLRRSPNRGRLGCRQRCWRRRRRRWRGRRKKTVDATADVLLGGLEFSNPHQGT